MFQFDASRVLVRQNAQLRNRVQQSSTLRYPFLSWFSGMWFKTQLSTWDKDGRSVSITPLRLSLMTDPTPREKISSIISLGQISKNNI